MNNPSQLYNDIAVSTNVADASSHRLIQLLLENALVQVQLSKDSIIRNEGRAKYQYLNRARDICEYLRLCLAQGDQKTNEMSELLTTVYMQCEKNLVAAALKNDVSYLDTTLLMLTNVKEGWDGIANQVGGVHG